MQQKEPARTLSPLWEMCLHRLLPGQAGMSTGGLSEYDPGRNQLDHLLLWEIPAGGGSGTGKLTSRTVLNKEFQGPDTPGGAAKG